MLMANEAGIATIREIPVTIRELEQVHAQSIQPGSRPYLCRCLLLSGR
jgi:hypothetical protein